MKRREFLTLLGLASLTGCATSYDTAGNTSDAGRRRMIQGRWYDQWLQGFNFANGVTTYRSDGTFTAAYESVAPGRSAEEPTQRELTNWSGKWKIEGGQLIEDILKTDAPDRTPGDRPLVRNIVHLDKERMMGQSANGNSNNYSRKKPKAAKVKFTPYTG